MRVLPEQIKPESIVSRFKAFTDKYYPEDEAKVTTHQLQPLSKIHFDEQYINNPVTPPTSM
jgi:hypothetical protein